MASRACSSVAKGSDWMPEAWAFPVGETNHSELRSESAVKDESREIARIRQANVPSLPEKPGSGVVIPMDIW